MWKVFPKLGLLKVLFFSFSCLYFSLLFIILNQTGTVLSASSDSFKAALAISTPVTLLFIGIVFILGKWGWRLLWSCPIIGPLLHTSVCPNLNGAWKGLVKSNFFDDDHSGVEVDIDVKCDLFGFRVNVKSRSGYQESKVIQSDIYKDPQTDTFYLSYIFRSVVPFPMETDDRLFEGAARLEVIIEKDKTTLRGTYWTNRAWQRRQNTAGVVTAVRA